LKEEKGGKLIISAWPTAGKVIFIVKSLKNIGEKKQITALHDFSFNAILVSLFKFQRTKKLDYLKCRSINNHYHNLFHIL
jgi:hypothetical protein